MKSDRDSLEPLLKSWSEVPAPSGRLAGPVWQRIEAVGARASWFGNFIMGLHDLETRFSRPRAIALVVAASLLVGVGIAEMRTRYDAQQIDTEMSARYLSMLDTSNR